MIPIPRCGLSAPSRRRQPFAIAFLLLFIIWSWHSTKVVDDEAYYRDKYPLAWQHVHLSSTRGGTWYIPPDWISPTESPPKTILEAAHFTARLATNSSHTIPYSNIPLIVHQTWKDTDVDTWQPDIAEGVEQWLAYATAAGNGSMAYFLWLDEGCKQLIGESEPGIVEYVDALPLKVEKSDVFRVLVLNSIGGVYGDIDTLPLRSPASWLDKADISPWIDPETGKSYSTAKNPLSTSSQAVQLMLGIEGDNKPDTDTYWRMGYNFPVQLTQWALASAPQHPILKRFISNFSARLKELGQPYGGNIRAIIDSGVLSREDPLQLTGPEAVTTAAKEWLEDENDLRWNALTGLEDGGRSKAVGDTIIFPITAFSPGRGKIGGMGSKAITDPDARVLHRGQGSWKTVNFKVELGKFCRTVFGGCRDWSKVP